MRVTWKLTAVITTSTVLILAVDGALRLRRERELFHQDTEHDLRVTARTLAGASDQELREEGPAGVSEVLAEAQRSSGYLRIRWVRIAAPRGSPDAPHPGLDLAALRAGKETVLHTGDAVVVAVPPRVAAARGKWALEVTEPLAVATRYLQDTLLHSAFTASLLALVAFLVAATAGSRLVGRPVGRLVDLARRIGGGDLAARVALRTGDELGLLGDELDAMAAQLERTRARLQEEVAARLEAESQLRHADRLATAGRLAAGIAHELGTPLNVVAGRAKLIATRELESEQVRENARIVGEQAARMTAIIRQLLDFTRRRASEPRLQDLRGVAERTADLLRSLAEKSRATLRLELPAEPVLAPVDATQLQQVITNLVVNGIQAMPEGGELLLEVGRATSPPTNGHAPAERAFLRVRDQGSGISPEHFPHVFEPFFTTKDVGQGTGLGLSVAHGIVAEHGGWVDVETAPGQGSSFTVWLPLELPQGSPLAVAAG